MFFVVLRIMNIFGGIYKIVDIFLGSSIILNLDCFFFVFFWGGGGSCISIHFKDFSNVNAQGSVPYSFLSLRDLGMSLKKMI